MHAHYDLRNYYFGYRIISNWVSLPDDVINANSIDVLENRIDNILSNQACYYDYEADLTGTGSQSQL